MTMRGNGMVLTTEGLKSTGRTQEENMLNQSLTGAASGGIPSSTLTQQRQFSDFDAGQAILSKQRTANMAGAARQTFENHVDAIAQLRGSGKFAPPKNPIKAWNATLPQTPTVITRSALDGLRANVKSTRTSGTLHAQPFNTIRRDCRPLSPDLNDSKKVSVILVCWHGR